MPPNRPELSFFVRPALLAAGFLLGACGDPAVCPPEVSTNEPRATMQISDAVHGDTDIIVERTGEDKAFIGQQAYAGAREEGVPGGLDSRRFEVKKGPEATLDINGRSYQVDVSEESIKIKSVSC